MGFGEHLTVLDHTANCCRISEKNWDGILLLALDQ